MSYLVTELSLVTLSALSNQNHFDILSGRAPAGRPPKLHQGWLRTSSLAYTVTTE